MLFLFTHVIFEVGAGAAQQKDAGALGMAVLAGQVQSRVPCLERGEQRGHTLATPPLAGGQDSQECHCPGSAFCSVDPVGVLQRRAWNWESIPAEEAPPWIPHL